MNGRQITLSPRGTPETPATEAAARAALAHLRDGPPADAGGDARSRGPTAAEAVDQFLTWAARRVAAGKMTPGCLKGYRRALAPFAAAFGPRPLGELPAEEIEEWAALPRPVRNRPKAAPRPWSSSTQNDYLGVVLSVFKRTKCPIRLEVPPKESRGAAVVLTDEQFAAVLAEVGTTPRAGDLAALLRALRETGARPGELSGLRVADVDWANGCVRLGRHKTKRKTGRDRLIVLTAAALAVLEGQRARYGAGLLFRGRDGAAYTDCATGRRLRRVGKRLGLRVTAYGLGRHSFATEKLKRGMPDSLVAAALGQKGTQMLHKHYSHLCEDARAIREAMDRADRRAG